MKKTTLSMLCASVLLSAGAMAADKTPGYANLEWNGTVPAADKIDGNGYWIVQDGITGFQKGTLNFKNDGTTVHLDSSDEIGFKVVKDEGRAGVKEPSIDIKPMTYKYKVTAFEVGIDGPAVTQTGSYFGLFEGGQTTPLALNTEVNKTTSLPTKLKVMENTVADKPVSLATGAKVKIKAALTITPYDSSL